MGKGKKDGFVVDTKNLCFLCYRPAKIVAAGVKGRVKDKRFSLRGISRFMDVDFQRLAKPAMSVSGQEGKFPQVLVTVCSRCSVLTEEFSALYQYMEFTQMKINACVRNLNELMKKSDCNAKLVENFRRRMKTSVVGSQGEANHVETLRNEIMRNCSSMLQNAFPRVKVKKLGGSTRLAAAASVKPSPRSKKPGFSSTILKADATRFVNDLLNPDDDDDIQVPEQKITGGMFQCLHCDHTFNDTGGLRVHIVRYHREQFFSMLRNPDVSEADFKIAVQLLFQDVRKITTNNSSSSTTSAVSFICTHCGKPFSAKIDTYMHMVQLHYDALSTKLQSIQKNKSMLQSAKQTVRLPDASTLHQRRGRGKRGPYKKRQSIKNLTANLASSSIGTEENAVGGLNAPPSVIQNISRQVLKSKASLVFPKTCECGVKLSSRSSWNNHLRLNCKLRQGTSHRNNMKTTSKAAQRKQNVFNRAKNTVGFPRTCPCGVRLTVKSSWFNHQKMHCRLRFGVAASNLEYEATDFNKTVPEQSGNAKLRKKQRRKGKLHPTSTKGKTGASKGGFQKNNKYICDCGSVLHSYSSWYSHTKRSCKLRDGAALAETDNFDMDLIEEVPIDITPTGDLCLPLVSTSIKVGNSPGIPKLMKSATSGVIQGLHRLTNFQSVVKKEIDSEPAKCSDSSSFSQQFLKYLSPEIPLEVVVCSLQKVLDEYRRFPGNISGCPYCGRGFTQVTELQGHMVEAHFDDVLHKLRELIDPDGASKPLSDGIIDVDPSLVKTECEKETHVPIDDLSLHNMESFERNFIEENEMDRVNPKEEMVMNTVEEENRRDDTDQCQFLL